MFIVYKHTSPSNKVYIGITSKSVKERWGCSGRGYAGQPFYRAIQKYGWDNFKHEIVYSNLDKQSACEKEKELIALYNSTDPRFGYNVSLGGELTQLGLPCSDDKKRKISAALIGRHPSAETRAKLSLARTGKSFTQSHRTNMSLNNAMHDPEYRKRVSQALKGRKFTPEHRAKLSAAHQHMSGSKNPMFGKHHSEETRRKISENRRRTNMKPVRCITTGEVFESKLSASKYFKMSESSVADSCKYSKSVKGYLFEEITTQEYKKRASRDHQSLCSI